MPRNNNNIFFKPRKKLYYIYLFISTNICCLLIKSLPPIELFSIPNDLLNYTAFLLLQYSIYLLR